MTPAKISFTFILFLIFCGCTSHQHPDKKIFHYIEQTGIASLDPAFAKNQSIMWAIHQLYSTLLEGDSMMQIKSSFAKSWEINSSRTIFTFHLRTDIFFHDDPAFANGKGRRLEENDVV